jgi:hypothetical protein
MDSSLLRTEKVIKPISANKAELKIWHADSIPTGLKTFSPGLRARATLGHRSIKIINSERVESTRSPIMQLFQSCGWFGCKPRVVRQAANPGLNDFHPVGMNYIVSQTQKPHT